MSYSVTESVDSNSRKRLRRSKESMDSMDNMEPFAPVTMVDDKLFDVFFPKHLESAFAAAIFELGLKNSSPKILMPLMPSETNLSTEHIKSHLQKYRIHRQRSKDEFFEFYNNYMKETFQQWESAEGWKSSVISNGASSSYGNGDAGRLGSGESGYALGDENGTERDDQQSHGKRSTTSALDAKVEYATSRYAKEILQETEAMLINLQSLCQEVVESGDVLKRKPEVQRCSVRLN